MGRGKKKNVKKPKWGASRSQQTQASTGSSSPDSEAPVKGKGDNGAQGSAEAPRSSAPPAATGGKDKGGQGSKGAHSKKATVTVSATSSMYSALSMNPPAPPITSPVASAVYAAMESAMSGQRYHAPTPGTVASAVYAAMLGEDGDQQGGKRVVGGQQVFSAAAGGKKGGKGVAASQVSSATSTAAAAGKKAGKGAAASQVSSAATTTAVGSAAGVKKGGKGAAATQASSAATTTAVGSAAGVKKGGKGVTGSEVSPATSGQKRGSQDGKGPAQSKKPAAASAGKSSKEKATRVGFRCFLCEKTFEVVDGNTKELFPVDEAEVDSIEVITPSSGGFSCKPCFDSIKSNFTDQPANPSLQNGKDSKEDEEGAANAKPSKSAKKRAAKKKKTQQTKEAENRAKERQRKIYLSCAPYAKPKDIQIKFKEVSKFLLDREVHLHNLVSIDFEKGLYMGQVTDAEDKKSLLRAAPRLKQSKELSSIFIHRALSHKQEKDLWESC